MCDSSACGTGLMQSAGDNQNGCFPDVDDATLDSVIILDPVLGTPVVWSDSMQATDWDISNSDATGTKLKRFIGKGSVGEPTIQEVEVAAGISVAISKTYALNIALPITSKEMRDYWRKLECGTYKPKFYYTSASKHVFGGANAIQSSKITAKLLLPEDDIQKVILDIEWRAKTSPDREDSPLPTAAQL